MFPFRILAFGQTRATARILAATFPESQVDVARDPSAASDLISAAVSEGQTYDAAILASGDGRSEETCYALTTRMRGTLIVHTTATPEDRQLLGHIGLVHLDPLRPSPATVVDTLNATWMPEIIRLMKAYLFGARIAAQLDALFGPTPFNKAQRSLTHDVAAVCHEIATHWDDLSDPLKGRIRGVFEVDEGRRPIKVGLLAGTAHRAEHATLWAELTEATKRVWADHEEGLRRAPGDANG